MDQNPDEPSVKRRKVRAGTHSCWECKRRKVRCIFASPDDVVCVTCRRRASKCISQEVADPDNGLQLQTPDLSPTRSPPSIVLPTTRSPPSIVLPSSHLSLTKALIKALPCQKDLTILLEKIKGIQLSFYRAKNHSGVPSTEAMAFTKARLSREDTHPVLLARQILLLVVGLQHCSFGENNDGLSGNPRSIISKLAESAIAMVTTNDLLLGTVESMDNLVLEGCYHTNNGNMQRGWISIRRSVMAAQLLNHKQAGRAHIFLDDSTDVDPSTAWPCVMAMERLISLILGLPTSVPLAYNSQLSLIHSNLPDMAGTVTAKIIERNDALGSQRALELTQQIDLEFIAMSGSLPAKFWQPIPSAGLQKESVDMSAEIQRVWDHLVYQTLMIQLHLPYMLFSSNQSQSMYSTNAVVNASRELLLKQASLRAINPVHPCLRMSELMALIADMALALAHILSLSVGAPDLLIHQRSSDRATVESSLESMVAVRDMDDDTLFVKSANTLRSLLWMKTRAMPCQSAKIQRMPLMAVGEMHETLTVDLAQGTIRLTRKGCSTTPLSGESGNTFTIGGFGVVQVVDLVDGLCLDAGVGCTTQQANAASDLVPPTENQFAQPPMADDWLFHGFNAGFFDVFARSGDLQLPQSGGSAPPVDVSPWDMAVL